MSTLIDARDSLSYWESRLDRLPRRAVRKRREARAMAARWRERVSAAEQAEYGPGFLGAVFQMMAERRLPIGVYARGRALAKMGVGVLAGAAVTVSALTVLALVAFVAVLSALL